MEYLAGALEECGHFGVVARREQEPGVVNHLNPNDLPVIEVIVDDSDNEICVVRSAASDKGVSICDFKSFYQTLALRMEEYPGYSLRVSEHFQIDDEHSGRMDMPLTGAEVDEDKEVVRLFF
jgi:hypothetical protein